MVYCLPTAANHGELPPARSQVESFSPYYKVIPQFSRIIISVLFLTFVQS